MTKQGILKISFRIFFMNAQCWTFLRGKEFERQTLKFLASGLWSCTVWEKLSSITTETTTKRSLLVYFPVSLKYLFCSPCPSCAVQYVVNYIFCYWKIPCWYRLTEWNFRSSRPIRLLEMPESTSCLRSKHFWYLHFLNSQMTRIIVTHTHTQNLLDFSFQQLILFVPTKPLKILLLHEDSMV